MWGKCSVIALCTVPVGQKLIHLLILCWVFLSNGFNFFILIFKLSSTNGKMWLWHHGLLVRTQLLCGWRYLAYFIQYLILVIMSDFTRWHLSAHILRCCVYVSAYVQGKGVHFKWDKEMFYSIHISGHSSGWGSGTKF